jgi:hypothetical protein
MRLRTVRLGSREVGISYPPALDPWFDGLVEAGNEGSAPGKWVHICPRLDSDRFDILTNTNSPASDLAIGETLAIFWERVGFLLIDDLRDAMAVHAAALRRREGVILLPGQTGSGKTRLSLWYRAQGFALGTDEVAALVCDSAGDCLRVEALPRPLMLKVSADVDSLRAAEKPVVEQDSPYGFLLRLAELVPWARTPSQHGLIIFPRFEPGAPLQLTALTTGETALGLIENCLNARNLPQGGLSVAGGVARCWPGIALTYGDTAQLGGTLDVLTRQALAAPITAGDLASLCRAFTAFAAMRTGAPAQRATTVQPLPEVPRRVVPAATAARFPRRLSIGMATYDDYDGVYFTVQSMRLNNPELEGALEFIVIDNNPDGPCSDALSQLGNWINGYRYIPRGEWSGTAIRNAVFEEASSPFVLCVDSHVVIAPGALSKLVAYFEAHPDSPDLLQGPMLYDDLRHIVTHMEPRWRAGMYGIWETDPRGVDPAYPAFDIPMHGLGLFACRRTAWPSFHAAFRGFGGEEGYIHEKIRRRGGRTLCLPFLRWLHRFGRPQGLSYANRWEDRIRNYIIGFNELGLDTAEMELHFTGLLGAETSARIFAETKRELGIG